MLSHVRTGKEIKAARFCRVIKEYENTLVSCTALKA